MKLKHLFFNALAVMAFAACSSEAEEIKPADKASTATLQLDMTGQYGTGNSDQTRALSLDGTEYPRFIHEEGVTNWSTHCFIRNEAGDVQFYALVDWNATTDSDGNISLHIKNSTLTLQNSAGSDVTATETLPKAGERWYIAGIAGGGYLFDNNTRVGFWPNESESAGSPHQVRVPLAFGWTRFTIPSNTERAPQISVQFQPQGTLLSAYVNNTSDATLDAGMRVISNAISVHGAFDYTLAADRSTYTSAPKWGFKRTLASTRIYSRNISIPANTGKNCYMWGMPRTEAEKPTSGFRTYIGLAGYAAITPNKITRTFTAGNTYAMPDVNTSNFRVMFPHEPLTQYNVAPDAQSFVTTQANNVSGFWNWADAVDKFEGIEIDGTDYYLPSIQEQKGLIPPYSGLRVRFSATTASDDYQEDAYISGWKFSFTSDYRGTTSGISYALRFKTTDNARLTAVRYQYMNNSDGDGKMLKITYRPLGPSGAATTITQVADETYWQSNTDADVTFYLPASGYYTADDVLTLPNTNGYYWSSTEPTSVVSPNSYMLNFHIQYASGQGSISKANKQNVRLFKVIP